MKGQTKRWAWIGAPLLAALLLAGPAWGRAGGGGSYSGGSHSSGSHSSSSPHSTGSHDSSGHDYGSSYSDHYSYGAGSGGGTELTGGQVAFLVGIMLLVLLLGLAWMLYQRLRQAPEQSLGTSVDLESLRPQVQDEQPMGRILEHLKLRDPRFDERSFLARIGGAFQRIQQAWSERDMAPARAFISDGVMERFSIQLELMKAQGLRNEVSAVNVLDARIVEVESDAHFDTLHVRLHANAVDRTYRLADNRLLDGSDQHADFVEVWSFLRRPGAKTLGQPGPMEGCCPSCGAALDITDAAQCASCKSWVNSGEYDWVLAEITQECEWAVRGSGADVPGYAALAQRDPALSTQFLEDRASVVFWRWQQALAQGRSAALRCVATQGWCETLDGDPVARRFAYRDAAVGAVEVLAFEAGESWNLAHVGVKWSGAEFEASAGGNAPAVPSPRQHVLVLGRRNGAATDPGQGLNSCRCPNCGAPPSSRELAACEYCATPFNDGSRQWVLVQMLPFRQWQAPRPQQAAAPAFALDWAGKLSSTETLAVMVSAMMADGPLGAAEREALEAYAASHRVVPGTVQGMEEAMRDGHLEIPRPTTPDEAQACLEGLIEVSLMDGKVEVNELKLILAYASRAGITPPQVAERIKQRRARIAAGIAVNGPAPAAPLSIVTR